MNDPKTYLVWNGFYSKIMNALICDNFYDLHRSEILEKAYNKVTKKIPASKYRQFIKKCMTKDTLLITKIRLQISIMTDEYRNLKLKISSMPNLKNKKTDAEVKLCKLMYLKQKRQLWEQLEIKKSIAEKLSGC